MDQDPAHVQVGEALEGGPHHHPPLPLLLDGQGKDLRPLTQGSPGLLDPLELDHLDVVAVYLDLLEADLLDVRELGLDQLEVL